MGWALAARAELCAIAVMAKAPRAGKVKTRLVPPLSHDQAMALSAAFLRDATENIAAAARVAPIAGYVAYAPVGSAGLFDGLLAAGTGLVLADGSAPATPRIEGFGRSLYHAASALFAEGYGSVCLLNSDGPTLPTSCLAAAAMALARPGDRTVLGPAEDGGYYLLGMKAPHAHLFEDVTWSTERVADQTRLRAAALGLETVTLPTWYDVDEPAALARLATELSDAAPLSPGDPKSFAAPATRACLKALGLAGGMRAATATAAAFAGTRGFAR